MGEGMAGDNGALASEASEFSATKSTEIKTFLMTTFIIIPGAAVAFVGAFGFAIWATQMIFGPPGPPS